MSIYHFPEKNVLRNYRSPFTELNISEIGLHDLRNIPPLLYTRKQDYFTLHFILNGRGTLFIDDKKYDLQENDMFFISPYQPHKYYAVPSDPWKYFWFILTGSLVGDYMKDLLFTRERPVYRCESPDRVKALANSFFSNNTGVTTSKEKMFAFFFELTAHIAGERQPKNTAARTETSDYIEKIKNLIFINYANPDFKIEDLSFMINLSHSYLCSIFKKETHISLKKYLCDIRMEQALDLLLNSELSVKEIAFQTGFTDSLYFSKSFKKQYGVSPSEYRKKR